MNTNWGFCYFSKDEFLNNTKNECGFPEEFRDKYEYILAFLPYQLAGEKKNALVGFPYYHYADFEQYKFGFSGYDIANKHLNERYFSQGKIYVRDLGYNLSSFYIKDEKTAKEICQYLNEKYQEVYPFMPKIQGEEPLKNHDNFEEAYSSLKDNTNDFDIVSVDNRKYVIFDNKIFMDITNVIKDDSNAKLVVAMLKEAFSTGYETAHRDLLENS